MLHHAQDSQYLDMSLCKKILLWQDISVWFGFRESNACANTNAASIFTKHTLGFQCPMVTKKVQATSPLSDILVVLSCHFVVNDKFHSTGKIFCATTLYP